MEPGTTRAPTFIRTYGGLTGDSAKRPPAGFDPQHELIEDLKRRDYIASAALPDAVLLAPDLLRQMVRHYQQVGSLVDWLCGALDLDY